MRRVSQILRQTRNRHAVVRFILHAVDSAQSTRARDTARETRNLVQTHRRRVAAFMLHRNFNAIRISRQRHHQMGMMRRQIFKRFLARRNHGLLQLCSLFARQARNLSEITGSSASRSRQTIVSVNL